MVIADPEAGKATAGMAALALGVVREAAAGAAAGVGAGAGLGAGAGAGFGAAAGAARAGVERVHW